MNDFEYLFSFYALLLGLSVANVASGFGDMWRERHAMPIGLCTPLLGLVVLAWRNQRLGPLLAHAA